MSTTVQNIPEYLRKAAAVLREAAKNATPGDWDINVDGELVAWQDTEDQRYDRLADGADWWNSNDPEWIALASPALAEPLAVWLESAAKHAAKCSDPTNQAIIADPHALAVARVILGGAE